ncbi:hypothetical protein MMC25_002185 [Agyrium rufum]|nr:hypothetical protein [Agyrium rufum]
MSPSGPSASPIHIPIPLPLTPHTTLHISLTPLRTSNILYLTTTSPTSPLTTTTTSSTTGHPIALSPLGSFVYAMPNLRTPSDPLCTTLVPVPGSVDFAMRFAKIMARKTGSPTYVGCSVVFGNGMGSGVEVDEEVDALRRGIEAVVGELVRRKEGKVVNGF